MSASLVSRVAPYCVALGFLLVAGSARAQFDECVSPVGIPDEVFVTIIDVSSSFFGNTTEKACAGVVKEAVKMCRAQVKGAQKCFDRAYDGNYKIGLKQCQAQETSEDRDFCKAEVKEFRDDGKSAIASIAAGSLSSCDGGFATAVSEACQQGTPP